MSYNLTNEQIKDTYQQLVQISGSTLVDGTGSVIPSAEITASYAVTASYVTSVSSPDWSSIVNKPAGIVSSSVQVNYQQISNVPSGIVSGSSQLTGSFDQRYVLSGSISQADWNTLLNKPTGLVSSSVQVDYTQLNNLPVGILSSSAQIATEISGAFDTTSGSLAGRIGALEQFSSSLDSTYVTDTELANATGSFLTTGSINNATITLVKANGSTFDLLVNNVANALTASFALTASYAMNTISGSVTWDQVLNIPQGLVSGSDQLTGSLDQRYALSGSAPSADWNTLLNKPAGLVSSSVQIDYTQISNVPSGLLSSSAQIATEISGAFDSTSGSLSSRVTNLENFSSSLDATFATDAELTAVSSSLASTITGVDGRLVILEGKTLLSSSAQIASEISGAFTSTSSSLANDITGLDTRLDTLEGKTLVSGSSQIILQDTTGNLSGSRIVGDVPSATSSSYANNADLLDGKDSTIFATTGSNSFVGNQTITGNLNVTSQFTASALTYPTADGVFGVEVLTTDGSGNLTLEIPETLYEEVKNDDIITLPKGTPVKVTGYQGNQALVKAADAGNPALMPASYILAQELAPQAEGLGIILGRISNIDTSGLTAGQEIYVAVGGGYTQIRPTGSVQVQPLGFPVKIASSGGSGVIMNSGVANDLPNLTQGYIWVGNSGSVPVTYPTSSFAKVNENNTFTGNQTFNNIAVNGTGSFAYIESVTGSAKIIGDAFIILNNNLPAEPYAGIKVIDSGSTNITASLLWDGLNNHWVYENVSGSTYGAAGLMSGPRSTDLNNILYPTQYKVLRSQGGDHVYDSNITDNDTNVSISIPLSVTGDITSSAVIKATGGFEGNVTGNASTATTASYANYVEYINVGNKPTLVSGSSQIDYTGLSNIPVGILSSSAQIATEISGAFDQASGSFSTRITNLEQFSSSLDSTYATDAELTAVSSSLASTITGVDGRLIILEGKTLISSSAQVNLSQITGTTFSTSGYTFPGSITLSGSVYNRVVNVTATSNTASIDFASGSLFALTIPSSSTTYVNPINIQQGQTINLLLTQQATTGSLTFDSKFKFESGSAYTPTAVANAEDILTFVTMNNTTKIYSSYIKRLI